MIQDYDDFIQPGEDGQQQQQDRQKSLITVPDLDNEFVRAKTFLQTGSTATGDNLYDHLTDVLNKILAERPENVIDFFEEYSRKVKEKRFRPLTDHLEDIYVHPPRYKLCKKLQPLLLPMGADEPSTMDPEDMDMADLTQLNMMQLLYYFEQAGVGLPKVEMFGIMLSIMRFVKKEPVNSVRFWGKIYGDYKNYLVLETELKDEALIKKHEANQEAGNEELKEESEIMAHERQVSFIMESIGEDVTTAGISRPLPAIPICHIEPVSVTPVEPSGTGVNKKAYYVCNEVGDEWVQLPDVTPQQLVIARQIKKSITGNLDQTISTYPEFPGTEANYLRVQIARISAGTQISPLGFYTFSEEGGEDEDVGAEEEDEGPRRGGGKTSFVESRRFDGVPLRDMLDPSLAFWVHHSMYILPQGRTTWWNSQTGGDELPGEEIEGEDEEEGKPRKGRPEPEIGPPLLTPLSEDSSLEAVAAWSVRASSILQPNYALAVVRSNIWPGAFCFATQGKLFQNIYLGDGLKYLSHNYSPKPLPPIQQEYPIGPEIMEMNDPTGADEEAWRIAHLPKEKSQAGGDEELGEEAEEEEENEEEDDDD